MQEEILKAKMDMLKNVGSKSQLSLYQKTKFSDPSDMKKIENVQEKIIEEVRLTKIKTKDVNFIVLHNKEK